MLKSLSILIPTFNDECVELVRNLNTQASNINKLKYEIIVADDGSTDKKIVKRNNEIAQLHNCRYIAYEKNRGRSAIRNTLISEAKCEWVLFIDGDMVVNDNNYISKYVMMEDTDVVYGGYVVNGDPQRLKGNLRYKYESKYGGNSDAKKRNLCPYNNFHTSNFLARRSIMQAYPFDERFCHYGYEDVIWGKTLKENGIAIRHKDNPLSFEVFEDNEAFLSKTEEGMHTLYMFRNELEEYSNIIAFRKMISKRHMEGLFLAFFKAVRKTLKNNLKGNKPSVFLFNIYKLGIYSELCKQKTRQ